MIDPASEKLIENIEVCESIRDAKIFSTNISFIKKLRQSPLLPEHDPTHVEVQRTNLMNIGSNENEFYVNLLICNWEREINLNGFYLARAKTFNGYFLITNDKDQIPPLVVKGLVMEFIDLQIVEDGPAVFQSIYKNQVKRACK